MVCRGTTHRRVTYQHATRPFVEQWRGILFSYTLLNLSIASLCFQILYLFNLLLRVIITIVLLNYSCNAELLIFLAERLSAKNTNPPTRKFRRSPDWFIGPSPIPFRKYRNTKIWGPFVCLGWPDENGADNHFSRQLSGCYNKEYLFI